SSMVVTSGDLIRHYHAFSHHNKGRPSSIQYLFILGVFTLCHSGAASLTGATKSWLKRVVPSVP
ncbi:hypothetical protein SJ511_23990, partial [Klebsiella pneumoniae]|uniref:hypothetical protein n=1 Tax=Klebsiella pneumoniae TaxID=573 RepID=UPI0029DE3C1C